MSATIEQVTAVLPRVRPFLSRLQLAIMAEGCRTDDRQFFKDKFCEIAATLDAMPRTGQTDGQGDEAVAYLHYFYRGCDWYITELDIGSPDDAPEDANSQCYGLSNIGFGGELGYISIPELTSNNVELDLHFTPTKLSALRAKEAA